MVEPNRTPGQAEGTAKDVETALNKGQKQKGGGKDTEHLDKEPGRTPGQAEGGKEQGKGTGKGK